MFNTMKELFADNNWYTLIDTRVREILNANKDFVYPDEFNSICNYGSGPDTNSEKCKGCIFGQAFQSLVSNVYEIKALSGSISIIVGRYRNVEVPRWSQIQKLQDCGMFWGAIFEHYYVFNVDIFKNPLPPEIVNR